MFHGRWREVLSFYAKELRIRAIGDPRRATALPPPADCEPTGTSAMHHRTKSPRTLRGNSLVRRCDGLMV